MKKFIMFIALLISLVFSNAIVNAGFSNDYFIDRVEIDGTVVKDSRFLESFSICLKSIMSCFISSCV